MADSGARPVAWPGVRAGKGGSDRESVYLLPGKWYGSKVPSVVTTILGSCVSVCLWDEKTAIGGLTHYLLPHWVELEQDSPRYGNVAIMELLTHLVRLGAGRNRLKAKVFGGACVLRPASSTENHLGMRNVEIAEAILGEQGIEIVNKDVGGGRGRKLIFHTDNGEAWTRQL